MKYFFTALISLMISFAYGQQPDSTVAEERDSSVSLSFELCMAAWNGDSSYTMRLLKEGADVNSVSDDGVSALQYAVQNGHLPVVKILSANGADVNYQYPGVKPALIMATLNNKFAIAKYLIKKGAKTDIADDSGNTSLTYASMYGYYDMVKLLLANNASPEVKNLYGESPLWLASYSGNLMIVYELLIYGADINTTNKLGYTPLMIAAMYNDTLTLKYLLENKADLNKTSNSGKSATEIAVMHSRWEAFRLLSRYKTPEKKEVKLICRSAVSNGDYAMLDSARKVYRVTYLKPFIGSMTLGYGFDATYNDMMFSTFLTWHEKRYRTAFRLGWSARYWRNRVEIETINGTFQLWERRNDLYAGFEKKIRVSKDENINRKSFFVGCQANYSMARYRGIENGPDPSFLFAPYLGFAFTGKYGGYGLRYLYYPSGVNGISPHRIGFYFNITMYNRSNDKHLVKCSECN